MTLSEAVTALAEGVRKASVKKSEPTSFKDEDEVTVHIGQFEYTKAGSRRMTGVRRVRMPRRVAYELGYGEGLDR